MARIATRKHSIFSCVCQAAVTAVFAQFAICLRLCHKYMTLGSFFLQFSHNKYAILSYKGEEKRITSETLHSTDLLPFVCSPIFPDLSHYDYFSKSLRRFSCHHTVTRTPHKGLELLSIQITKKLGFFPYSSFPLYTKNVFDRGKLNSKLIL